jgi:Flp pilus assembly protein TadD
VGLSNRNVHIQLKWIKQRVAYGELTWYSVTIRMGMLLQSEFRSVWRWLMLASKFGLVLALACLSPPLRGQSATDKTASARQEFMEYVASGSRALEKGDNAAAEKAFRGALSLDPSSVEILNNLAISLSRQGRESEAVAAYERALHLKPADAVTQRNLGVAYFRAHQYRLALPLLQKTADRQPSFQAAELAGLDAFALDRYADAARYLAAAHGFEPNDLETLDMLGKAYLRTKNYSGVTEVFQQIMAIQPDSAAAHTMMAMAYDKLYREQDAIKEFEAARASDPTYPGIHTGLGIIYWRNDNLDAAEREFREELKRYPTDPIANCTLGRILRRRNQTDEAVVYLKAALAANPSYRDALLELGECYIRLGRPAEAVEPLRKVTESAADDAEAHFILGTALSKSGHPSEGAKERELCARIREKERSRGAGAPTAQ